MCVCLSCERRVEYVALLLYCCLPLLRWCMDVICDTSDVRFFLFISLTSISYLYNQHMQLCSIIRFGEFLDIFFLMENSPDSLQNE